MTGREPDAWRSRFDPRRGQGLEPVQVGDYVYTAAGTTGRVIAEWWTDPADGREQRMVRVAEDHGVDEPGDMPYHAEDCVAVHGPHGSRQRCDALFHDRRCRRWAARAVTVWQTDKHGRPVLDDRGYQLAGTCTERAVCWEHLPTVIVWAEQRYDSTFGLHIDQPVGGSSEPPDNEAGWDLDVPRRAPDQGIRPRQRNAAPDRDRSHDGGRGGWEL